MLQPPTCRFDCRRPPSSIAPDFKFDFNAYLLSRPDALIHSLEEVPASGKYRSVGESRALATSGYIRVKGQRSLVRLTVRIAWLRLWSAGEAKPAG